MGHKNNNIYKEAIDKLVAMQSFGVSKHICKQENSTQDKIFSYATFKAYKEKSCEFISFARKEHKCKTLEQAKPFIREFLQDKIDKGYSPWTIKLYACSLGKLYQEKSNSFIELPTRERCNITRSRECVARDRHFSLSKNETLIDFCKSSGLRRSELENLKREDCRIENGQVILHITNGKGGKTRDVYCLEMSPKCVEKIMKTPSNERVWGKVHSCCDVHGYRSCFANELYNKLARPIEKVPRCERYYCRKDMVGRVFDKVALQKVSQMLGHERICVLPYSYLK